MLEPRKIIDSEFIVKPNDWVGRIPHGCPMAVFHVDEDVPHGEWRGFVSPEFMVSAVIYGVDASAPRRDHTGQPMEMDALPYLLEKLAALFGHLDPEWGPVEWEMEDALEMIGYGADSPEFENPDFYRLVCVKLFAFRGPNGERAWEMGGVQS